LKKLILSHLYCVQFGLDDTLTESGQDSAYVFDLLTDFGLYRREYSKGGNEKCVKYRFQSYWPLSWKHSWNR